PDQRRRRFLAAALEAFFAGAVLPPPFLAAGLADFELFAFLAAAFFAFGAAWRTAGFFTAFFGGGAGGAAAAGFSAGVCVSPAGCDCDCPSGSPADGVMPAVCGAVLVL